MPIYGSDQYSGHSGLATNPFTQYAAGQTFETKVLLNADHGGDAAWMLCPYSEEETEECFRDRIVHDWEDVHAFWGGDSTEDHWKDNQWFPQNITLPADLEPGNYTLRWIWICKFTDEIFVSCIDMDIGAAGTELLNPDPLGNSPESGAGSGGGGSSGCTAQWGDCLSSHSCCSASDTCFEKDGYYAQCRPDCTGTGGTADFSCKVLGEIASTTSPTPTMAPTAPTMAPTYPTMAPTAPTMAPTAPTMTPTMAPTASTSCTNPTEDWGDCTMTKCCNSGWTCYEKDAYYAQCRLPCPPEGESGWTCNVLAPTAPTMAPTAPTMAPTAPTMAPTAPTMAPTAPTMTPTAPTMAPTASTSCTNSTGNWGNCSTTKCCNTGWTCYEKDAYYAQCLPCPPNAQNGWTCNVLTSLLATSSTRALVQAAANTTATCVAKGQSCASTPCCDGTCFEKDEFTAECKDECTDADKAAGWSCFKLAHPAANSGASCSKLYDQCGGNRWSGPRSCCEGTCEVVDSNYHQCKKKPSLRQIKRHSSFLAVNGRSARASAFVQQETEMTHGICSVTEVDDVEEDSEEFKEEL